MTDAPGAAGPARNNNLLKYVTERKAFESRKSVSEIQKDDSFMAKAQKVVEDSKLTKGEMIDELGMQWKLIDREVDASVKLRSDGKEDMAITDVETGEYYKAIDEYAQLKFNYLYNTDKEQALAKAKKEYLEGEEFAPADFAGAIGRAEDMFRRFRNQISSGMKIEDLLKKDEIFKGEYLEELKKHLQDDLGQKLEGVLGNNAAQIFKDLCYYQEYLGLGKGTGASKAAEGPAGLDAAKATGPTAVPAGKDAAQKIAPTAPGAKQPPEITASDQKSPAKDAEPPEEDDMAADFDD